MHLIFLMITPATFDSDSSFCCWDVSQENVHWKEIFYDADDDNDETIAAIAGYFETKDKSFHKYGTEK